MGLLIPATAALNRFNSTSHILPIPYPTLLRLFTTSSTGWHARCDSAVNLPPIMKNFLNYLTLLSVAALTATAAFELLGGTVSSPLPYALSFGAFVSGLVLSTFREDYASERRSYEPRRVKPILLPADEVFAPVPSRRIAKETPVSWTSRHRRLHREAVRN